MEIALYSVNYSVLSTRETKSIVAVFVCEKRQNLKFRMIQKESSVKA